ncbi:hypothetical protein HUJ05_007871 [Dendroctonus ponderosae]|nr:hypothetical protein HUJ05_007871 [Dendroctonus ponderosae]
MTTRRNCRFHSIEAGRKTHTEKNNIITTSENFIGVLHTLFTKNVLSFKAPMQPNKATMKMKNPITIARVEGLSLENVTGVFRRGCIRIRIRSIYMSSLEYFTL